MSEVRLNDFLVSPMFDRLHESVPRLCSFIEDRRGKSLHSSLGSLVGCPYVVRMSNSQALEDAT
jgi:hypothetical protein